MNTLYWLWLQAGMGHAAYISDIIFEFKTAESFYNAGPQVWQQYGFFGGVQAALDKKRLDRLKSLTPGDMQKTLEACERHGVSVLTPESEAYPKKLLSLGNPPAALFVRGNAELLSREPCVTVAGSRRPTRYGLSACEKISRELCENGAVILSGGALGIDGAAAAAALEAGSEPVIVMPCGHDSSHLPENAPLRSECEHSGAVICEYPPETSARLTNYVMRNRILCALSSAVCIVEASDKSGALNIASQAAGLHKDVFVVPGDVYSKSFAGSNRLLTQGARACFCGGDVLTLYSAGRAAANDFKSAGGDLFPGINEYPLGEPKQPSERGKRRKSAPKHRSEPQSEAAAAENEKENEAFDVKSVSNNAQIVYNLILSGCSTLDELAATGSLPVPKLLGAITELELEGAVSKIDSSSFKISK